MISSETLRKIALLNLSPEQMAGVLEVLADGLEKEEQRKKKQRERKQRSRDSHSTVTRQSCDIPPNGSNGSDGFPDPSLTPITSLSPHKENPPKGGQKKNPMEFETWWLEYPHKIGKAAAEKSYDKARLIVTPAELIDGIRRYIATKPPDQAYCNPATWLNQERWKDQPAERTDYANTGRNTKQNPNAITTGTGGIGKSGWTSAAEQIIAEDRARAAAERAGN